MALNTFNTVYQLLADKDAGRLSNAVRFFMLPEYLSYKLTGSLQEKQYTEYTDASTTGLLDANTRQWAFDIINKLGLPKKLFTPVKEPPYVIGGLSQDLQKELGFDADIMMIASHDTASAVSTIAESDADTLYISSGTWSLLGIICEPILTDSAREANYTNEGAHNGKIRFLKNIMGLWMIQSLKRELCETQKTEITYAELETLARKTGSKLQADGINYFIDVNLQQFTSPPSMIKAIQDECKRMNNCVPQSAGELAYCIYTSLAKCYDIAIRDLEEITNKKYDTITIIGGGNKDSYLNELTEKFTGKKVIKGLTEATAAGNLLLQLKGR
jgi:rhamnulokinase